METKKLAPTNIQKRWIQKLESEPHSVKNWKELIKITLNHKGNPHKVLINEVDNWFLLISTRNILFSGSDSELDELIMNLSARVPIGYFDYTLKSQDHDYFQLHYKTHQRFIRNDDDFSIDRSIDLHLEDHRNLFLNILTRFNSENNIPDLRVAVQVILKDFEDVFKDY